MKKEFIMSEEERTVKRRKIEENRMKKTKPARGSSHATTGPAAKQLVRLLNGAGGALSGNQVTDTKKALLDVRSEPESSYSESDISPSPVLDNSSESFQDPATPSVRAPASLQGVAEPNLSLFSPEPAAAAQCVPIEPKIEPDDDQHLFANMDSTMEALLNTAIRSEYNVGLDLVRGVALEDPYSPLSPVRDRQLNEMERAKLHELVVANKALLAPLTEDGPVNVKKV